MSPLSQRNDEIYRRWKAGENYIDLAREYDRYEMDIQTMLRNRSRKEARGDRPKGPSNKHLHEQNSHRDFKIVTERGLGKTYRQLAKENNLSPSRVRTIVENAKRKKMGDIAYLAEQTRTKTSKQEP
jgi:Mor family transcriptional regulator